MWHLLASFEDFIGLRSLDGVLPRRSTWERHQDNKYKMKYVSLQLVNDNYVCSDTEGFISINRR